MTLQAIKPSTLWIQLLATLILSILAAVVGFVFGWPSHAIKTLISEETVLSRPMTAVDVAWLGSLPTLGGFLGTPVSGYAYNKLGRKYSTVLFSLPFVISWTIIIATKSVPMVLAASAIAGIGISGQKYTVIYLSEVSHDSIRGGLSACTAVGYYLGILMSNMMAGYMSYYYVLYAQLTISVVCVVGLMMLKESPVYLIMIGKEEEAAKSIAFYYQVDVRSKVVAAEISKIKLQLNEKPMRLPVEEKDIEATNELIKTKPEAATKSNLTEWQLFRNSKSSQRALFTVLSLTGLSTFMGMNTLQVYAEPLFKQAVPSMSPNSCAVIMAVNFTVSSAICALVIDRVGRKSLMMVTAALSSVCTLTLATQLQLQWAPQWFTALVIYVFSFVFTLGCAGVPNVLVAEIFLPEVRGFCSSVAIGGCWLLSFVTLFIFYPAVQMFGLDKVFYFYTFVSVFCTIYTKLRLPETKGISTYEIQDLFLKM